MIRKVWNEEKIPKEWKTSIIVPLRKRGELGKTGISLLCSAYKVYAGILRNRLEREVEGKGMLAESQTEFRKGKSTLDNVFVLNHITQREKKKKRLMHYL